MYTYYVKTKDGELYHSGYGELCHYGTKGMKWKHRKIAPKYYNEYIYNKYKGWDQENAFTKSARNHRRQDLKSNYVNRKRKRIKYSKNRLDHINSNYPKWLKQYRDRLKQIWPYH